MTRKSSSPDFYYSWLAGKVDVKHSTGAQDIIVWHTRSHLGVKQLCAVIPWLILRSMHYTIFGANNKLLPKTTTKDVYPSAVQAGEDVRATCCDLHVPYPVSWNEMA